jgi:hypothetical protein
MPGLYHTEFGDIATFCGLIASSRVYNRGRKEHVTFVGLGCGGPELIDVVLPGMVNCRSAAVIEGHGRIQFHNGVKSIQVQEYTARTLDQHERHVG